MSDTNTGKQSGAPALMNNFSGKTPMTDSAPKIGSQDFSPSPNSNERGKDGTSK